MITAHADVVGSLLRPSWLLEGQERLRAGEITRPAYKSIEDRAVNEAVAQQEEAGLTVLTDGEMRRLSFQSQMVEAVEGLGAWDIGAFLWGDWQGDDEIGDLRRERPKDLGVVAPLRRRRSLSAEEFVYLRARTARTSQGDATQSRAVCQFLVPRSLARCLPFARELSRGRGADPARGGGRARRIGGELHPARRAALSLAARAQDARVLRSTGLEPGRMAGAGRRVGQPGDGRHRRRDLRLAPVPIRPAAGRSPATMG